jgi:hypothetical protein
MCLSPDILGLPELRLINADSDGASWSKVSCRRGVLGLTEHSSGDPVSSIQDIVFMDNVGFRHHRGRIALGRFLEFDGN